MKYKRGLALLLVAFMTVSAAQPYVTHAAELTVFGEPEAIEGNLPGELEGAGEGGNTGEEGSSEDTGNTEEGNSEDTGNTEEGSSEDTGNTEEGSSEDSEEDLTGVCVTNLQAVYQENKELITLSFEKNNCAYVRIYVNGKVVASEYTGTAYDYDDAEEGVTCLFAVEAYDADGKAGKTVELSFMTPYKKAVVDGVDVDYNLEKEVLVVDWSGSNIASADVYQDNELLASKVAGGRLLMEIKLEPLSKHTYKVVPYNRNQEEGTGNSFLLEVDDYVAKLETSEISYNDELKQIQMKWEDIYTEYVDIYLNDEVLVEKYRDKSYIYNCQLQPGATYKVTVVPFNFRNEEGESMDEDVSIGYFDVPDTLRTSVISLAAKDAAGSYTGFSRPGVNVSWTAQGQAVYEIYRAQQNKKSSYAWIATVKADKSGTYNYIDERTSIGTYYYKIRRKIVRDQFISQELFTALSSESKAAVSVPKATVKAKLNAEGQILLTLDSSREYVSGYDIYRKTTKGTYRKIASVTGDEYVDTEVEFGKTYYYKAKAYYYEVSSNKKSTGKFSNAAKVKNTIGSIEAEAEAIKADTIKLTWTPAVNAQGYEIYYKSGTQGDSYVLWQTTEQLSLTRKVKKTGTYAFMIKAYRITEKGKTYFSSAEVTCKMGFTAPKGLQIKKTSYKFDKAANVLIQKDTLCWKRVYDASGYYIDVYDPVSKKYNRIATVKKGSTTSYTISSQVVSGAKPVKYRISAYAGSTVKKGETIEITPQLGTASGLKAVKSGSKVKISWKSVVGAESYRIYRSNGRTMLLVGETNLTSITDIGLSVGVSYRYYVQAVNQTLKLTGENSMPVSYEVSQAKVSKLTAVNASAGKVQLAWNTAGNAQSYVIYYKTSPEDEYQKIAEVSNKKTSYVHTKQTVGITCYYRVTAVQKNSGGINVESAPVSVKVNIEK